MNITSTTRIRKLLGAAANAVRLQVVVGAFAAFLLIPPVMAESAGGDSQAELAKKLANPTAALISVPLQSNWDYNIGPAEATRYTLNVQPVVPFSLNEKWNLIVRTIVPYIDTESPIPGGPSHSGLSDTLQSFFFSPKEPTSHGWIWGAGPVFLWPTATDSVLGTEKWGVGPTAVVLKQSHGWTYGVLANHVWSYAGDDTRAHVNASYVLPFISYTTHTHTTLQLNSESTYDWSKSQWSAPLNLNLSQLLKIRRQIISVGVGVRHWMEVPQGGPDWGMRFTVTLLFPKNAKKP